MQHVTLIKNPLGPPEEWKRVSVPDVRDFLMDEFEAWPASARIYHGVPSMDRDVTPRSEGDIERLPQFDELTVVVYPGGPVAGIFLIISAVIAVVAIAATFLLMPKIPSMENQSQQSPNNGLAQRSNRPRPNARVPDIYGTVRSIPDLIAVPYRIYEQHAELEIAYMCVGRGAYAVSDVRDGDTLVSEIDLASCQVFAPYTSPNDGSTPQLQIGSAIGDPVFDVTRLNDVNGQTLKGRNDRSLTTTNNLRFKDGGIIESADGTIDFTDYFVAGDLVDVGGAQDDGGDINPNAIQVAAVANAGGFTFTGYNPTADFSVGNIVQITGAVYQFDDGGTSGSLGGGTTYPDYPRYGGDGRVRGQLP